MIVEKDFLPSSKFIQIGIAPVRIDITTAISGTTFDQAYQSRVQVDVNGIQVPVIGIDELIKNKLASARKQDIADVEKLAKVKVRKKKK